VAMRIMSVGPRSRGAYQRVVVVRGTLPDRENRTSPSHSIRSIL
jgi:hypothetical protein